jgi:hypothetical protein
MLNFPNSPITSQIFSAPNGINYIWDGVVWRANGGPIIPLDSPVFTGDPQAPTPAVGDNDASIATTQFVKTAAAVNNVKWFGAIGDGSANDAPAINNAITAAVSNGLPVVVPSGTYRITSTIVVSAGVVLQGTSFLPGAPVAGSRIVADAGLAVAVDLIGGGNNGTAALKDITVTRAGTSPATSTIGIRSNCGYNLWFENVMAENHGICWMFLSNISIGAGISAHLTNCYSARATDAHIVVDSWPEVYWMSGRIGDDGSGDYSCNTHVRCQGGLNNTAGGPNTVTFIGVQFNQGSNKTAHWWELVNLNGDIPDIDAGNFYAIGCHIEGVSSAYFYSDATWNIWPRIFIDNCFFNDVIPGFALNAATSLSEWRLTNNVFACSTFNIGPCEFDKFVMAGCHIIGSTTFNSNSVASEILVSDCYFDGALNIQGTNWGFCKIAGCVIDGGYTNSATAGVVLCDASNVSEGDWTPTLTFGGASTGWAYSSSGHWQREGRYITASYEFQITTKGTAVGIAEIGGLPFPNIGDALNGSSGGPIVSYVNFGGLSSPPWTNVKINATTAYIFHGTASGNNNVTDGHFANTGTIQFYGWIKYLWR